MSYSDWAMGAVYESSGLLRERNFAHSTMLSCRPLPASQRALALVVFVVFVGCSSSSSSSPPVDASSGCPASVPRDGDACPSPMTCSYSEAGYPCGRVIDCLGGTWSHKDLICPDAGKPLYCTTKGGICGEAVKGCPAGSHEVLFGDVAFPCYEGDPPDSSVGAPQYVPCCFPGAPSDAGPSDASDASLSDAAPSDAAKDG